MQMMAVVVSQFVLQATWYSRTPVAGDHHSTLRQFGVWMRHMVFCTDRVSALQSVTSIAPTFLWWQAGMLGVTPTNLERSRTLRKSKPLTIWLADPFPKQMLRSLSRCISYVFLCNASVVYLMPFYVLYKSRQTSPMALMEVQHSCPARKFLLSISHAVLCSHSLRDHCPLASYRKAPAYRSLAACRDPNLLCWHIGGHNQNGCITLNI